MGAICFIRRFVPEYHPTSTFHRYNVEAVSAEEPEVIVNPLLDVASINTCPVPLSAAAAAFAGLNFGLGI